MNNKQIHIVGAGPSGLTAAINLARAGFKTIVYEKYSDVGIRFSGESQGLEIWSMKENVNGEYHFLLDENLGLEVYDRVSPARRRPGSRLSVMDRYVVHTIKLG
jgi:flavin-dependent dehydrogenase